MCGVCGVCGVCGGWVECVGCVGDGCGMGVWGGGGDGWVGVCERWGLVCACMHVCVSVCGGV